MGDIVKWVLVVIGLGLTLYVGVWNLRHPREEGEPRWSRRRKWYFVLASLGAVLLIVNFVITLTT